MSLKFTQIKETCLYVTDTERSIDFYRDMIGLKLFAHRKGELAFFQAGTSVLLCFNPEITKGKNRLPPHYAYGEMHIAFESEKGKEYDDWKNKIRKAGIAIEQEEIWPKGHRSFYFRDPDRHLLEVVEKGMWG